MFVDNSDKLIKDGHVHANHIETHRSEVLRNRENVYVAATKRKTKLEHALAFENLRRNVNELGFWINAKKRIAADDSFKKDGAVLDRDLLKHQAFMAEIHSNSVQLSKIQKVSDSDQ